MADQQPAGDNFRGGFGGRGRGARCAVPGEATHGAQDAAVAEIAAIAAIVDADADVVVAVAARTRSRRGCP